MFTLESDLRQRAKNPSPWIVKAWLIKISNGHFVVLLALSRGMIIPRKPQAAKRNHSLLARLFRAFRIGDIICLPNLRSVRAAILRPWRRKKEKDSSRERLSRFTATVYRCRRPYLVRLDLNSDQREWLTRNHEMSFHASSQATSDSWDRYVTVRTGQATCVSKEKHGNAPEASCIMYTMRHRKPRRSVETCERIRMSRCELRKLDSCYAEY